MSTTPLLAFVLAPLFLTVQEGAPQAPAEARPEAPRDATEDLAERLAKLEQRFAARMEEAHVPGAALAVVVGGEVVLARGFGLADLEAERAVTADTLFAIGSATKAFTATALATLVDEGRMGWEDPVTRYLPEFELVVDPGELGADEAVVTLRDLLCHRTGFTRMGVLWASGGADRATILATATKAEPWAPFRAGFHYNNVMYLAAGEASAVAAGTSWDELVQERLLGPLGMDASTTREEEVREREDLALGYRWDDEDERFERDPRRRLDTIAPAGALYSTASDMTRWLRLQLGDGVFEEQRLVSAEALVATRSPQVVLGPGVAYGLGWFLEDWQGHRVVHHGGNIDGFSSMVCVVPDEQVGFVLLTNVSASALQNGSRALVLEALLPAHAAGEVAEGGAGEDVPAGTADRAALLGKYVANYAQFEDEEFEVLERDGALAVDIPSQMVFELLPADEEGRHPFALVPDVIQASFVLGEDGRATHLVLHQNGLAFDVPRKGLEVAPDCEPEEYAHLFGTYEHPLLPEPFRVYHRAGRVVCDIPGQMVFDLRLPDEAGVWWFRATDELGVEFHLGEDGRATSATFHERGTETECALLERVESELPTVEEVLALRGAAGLAERLEALGNLRWRGTTRLVHSGVEGTSVVVTTPGGAFRSEDDFGVFGRSVTSFDGERGWIESSFDPFEELSGRALAQARLANPAAFFGDWREWFDEVRVTRALKVDGAERVELKLTLADLPTWTVQVDAATGDLVRLDTRTVIPGVGSFPRTVHLGDYRDVGGVRMPFEAVTESEENGRVVVRFEAVEPLVELPADVFTRR